MSATSGVVTVMWTGQSGTKYQYWAYPLGTQLKTAAGNYCFAKRDANGNWTALYFGQTGDLSERFDNHHKLDCARRRGATHIHAHLNNQDEAARLREESDLVNYWQPDCNG